MIQTRLRKAKRDLSGKNVIKLEHPAPPMLQGDQLRLYGWCCLIIAVGTLFTANYYQIETSAVPLVAVLIYPGFVYVLYRLNADRDTYPTFFAWQFDNRDVPYEEMTKKELEQTKVQLSEKLNRRYSDPHVQQELQECLNELESRRNE